MEVSLLQRFPYYGGLLTIEVSLLLRFPGLLITEAI